MSILHGSDLVLGGVRSGKSREALRLSAGLPPGFRGAFLATAQALDADMRARIQRHQAERPRGWATVEEPRDVVRALEGMAARYDVVVLDCITLWVANLFLGGEKAEAVVDAADGLARFIGLRRVTLIIVSNEVGAGVHPPTEVGLHFRDILGEVNQHIAAAVDRVTYMVAGIPTIIKNTLPARDLRGESSQAP